MNPFEHTTQYNDEFRAMWLAGYDAYGAVVYGHSVEFGEDYDTEQVETPTEPYAVPEVPTTPYRIWRQDTDADTDEIEIVIDDDWEDVEETTRARWYMAWLRWLRRLGN